MSEALKISSNPTDVVIPKQFKGNIYHFQTDMRGVFASLKSSHYFTENGTTQYFTFETKKKEKAEIQWMAKHIDEHHDIFCKFPIAIIEEIKNHKVWIDKRPNEIKVNVIYPLLIVQGELWNIIQNGEAIQIDSKNHIHYLRCTQPKADEKRPELSSQYQHIDIITEDYLKTFLVTLDAQLQELKTELIQNEEHYINALVKEANLTSY